MYIQFEVASDLQNISENLVRVRVGRERWGRGGGEVGERWGRGGGEVGERWGRGGGEVGRGGGEVGERWGRGGGREEGYLMWPETWGHPGLCWGRGP